MKHSCFINSLIHVSAKKITLCLYQVHRQAFAEVGIIISQCAAHDESDIYKAQILTRMFDDPKLEHHLPRPFGVFYQAIRPTYEDMLTQQIEHAKGKKAADLDKLLRGNEVWDIA